MFTGIIRQIGFVRRVSPGQAATRFTIDVGSLAPGLGLGDSVAVNGACLTVADLGGSEAGFDAIHETLSRTTLGQLRAGSRVNLERAVRADQSLDGHLVQGHVDGVAVVATIDRAGGKWEAQFENADLAGQLIEKGSVTIAGVSLTVTGVSGGRFGVALIPTTLADTTLADLRVGDMVNVETDLIGKYVRAYLTQLSAQPASVGLTLEKLRQAGFL